MDTSAGAGVCLAKLIPAQSTRICDGIVRAFDF
jgi:hypothetical protein